MHRVPSASGELEQGQARGVQGTEKLRIANYELRIRERQREMKMTFGILEAMATMGGMPPLRAYFAERNENHQLA
jgi:hypothetical protein